MKSQTGYILLDFRFEFEEWENKDYDCDPDQPLTTEDKQILLKNVQLLKNENIEITSVEEDYGTIIIKTSRDLDNIPYVDIQPDISQCSINGVSCIYCGWFCREYDDCKLKNKNNEGDVLYDKL